VSRNLTHLIIDGRREGPCIKLALSGEAFASNGVYVNQYQYRNLWNYNCLVTVHSGWTYYQRNAHSAKGVSKSEKRGIRCRTHYSWRSAS